MTLTDGDMVNIFCSRNVKNGILGLVGRSTVPEIAKIVILGSVGRSTVPEIAKIVILGSVDCSTVPGNGEIQT